MKESIYKFPSPEVPWLNVESQAECDNTIRMHYTLAIAYIYNHLYLFTTG